MYNLLKTLDSNDLPNVNIPLLLEGLRELDELVGMVLPKTIVESQIKFILGQLLTNSSKPMEEHLLNIVISGPPGVGKTCLAKVLAKIFFSLGIVTNRSTIKEHDIGQTIHTCISKVVKGLPIDISPESKLNLYFVQELSRTLINPEPELKLKFKVVDRGDLVAAYTGQTAIKTKKLLESMIGGVLFIDEAYSLILGDRDSFGMEALTVINQWMSEHPSELVIIFAGYRKQLENSIFRAQPGLKRRIGWYIDIDKYESKELASIFKSILFRYEWEIDTDLNLNKWFSTKVKDFPNYGGDLQRLAMQCKLEYSDRNFIYLFDKSKKRKLNKCISEKILNSAFEKYNSNCLVSNDLPPQGMYR